ncbi:MAG: hypothetical protein AAFW83_10865 [Pseudomonadota bacterium]
MTKFNQSVFVNCPFDKSYDFIFNAIIFVIYDCGYIARCAKEEDDSGSVRAQKIYDLISECRYGIHDISETKLCEKNSLPRFNMPYELGLFIGCKELGFKKSKTKRTLVFDVEKHRYQKFLSDFSGQDIKAHSNKPELAIKGLRDWFGTSPDGRIVPGPTKLVDRYNKFLAILPKLADEFHIRPDEITYNNYCKIAVEWIRNNPF